MELTMADAGRSIRSMKWVAMALLTGALLWAAWPSIGEMAQKWSDDPRYTHGFLVPAFALYLLWRRRSMAAAISPTTHWLGVVLIGIGAAVKFAGAYIHFAWLDAVSLLPSLAGLAVLLGGRPALRWAWPSIAFLFFMIPLPNRVAEGLG